MSRPKMVVIPALAMATLSYAVAPVGVLNITGNVRITPTEIDFLPLGGGSGPCALGLTQSGFWTTLAGTACTIKDLNSAAQPVGVPFVLSEWLTFAGNPLVSLRLTFIPAGTFSPAACALPPAAGQQCTPPGSPFNLQNISASSSIASFQVSGTAIGTLGEEVPFTGIFSTQFPAQNFQQLLAAIAGPPGYVEATYSASFVVQGQVCTRTQGYWKNHENWPVTSLMLGTTIYTQAQLTSILQTPVKGNGLVSLAHQLIAAMLNAASGTPVPPGVLSAIATANALINGLVIPPVGGGSLPTSTTSPLVQILDQYNNGVFPGGPPHCG